MPRDHRIANRAPKRGLNAPKIVLPAGGIETFPNAGWKNWFSALNIQDNLLPSVFVTSATWRNRDDFGLVVWKNAGQDHGLASVGTGQNRHGASNRLADARSTGGKTDHSRCGERVGRNFGFGHHWLGISSPWQSVKGVKAPKFPFWAAGEVSISPHVFTSWCPREGFRGLAGGRNLPAQDGRENPGRTPRP